jgi:hypothetical protein
MSYRGRAFVALFATLLGACSRAPQVIDNAALANEQDGTNWPAFGRTFSEGHYSPLDQINADTVRRLGLAWSLDLDVTNSITAPLAIDGVIYLGAGHGIVHAVDAKTGTLLWRYDARAPEAAGAKMRVAWGIRGIAFWKGRVYAGTTDGRLIALNAKTARSPGACGPSIRRTARRYRCASALTARRRRLRWRGRAVARLRTAYDAGRARLAFSRPASRAPKTARHRRGDDTAAST